MSPVTRGRWTTPPRSARCRSTLGTGWAKSLSFTTGSGCPVARYNHVSSWWRSCTTACACTSHARVNAKAISLDDAPGDTAEFDAGAATKYVLNPNGYIAT